jgi:hypothetical protein
VSCTPTNKPDGESCNDGDVATAADYCDGQGSCVGTPIECEAETECARHQPNGVGCTMVAKSGLCDDGLDTTHSDVCIEGECRGTAYACAPAQCEASSVANGIDCTVSYKDDGAPCNDGNVNTRDDACDGNGACAGTLYGCTPGLCEASSVPDGEGCIATPALPGDACNDLDGCTIDDICDGAGDCMGEPVECGEGEVCDGVGGCKLTHCVACAEDEECGDQSLCVPLTTGTRCLVRCENDLGCAFNQVCRMHASGNSYCFDHGGSCVAPGEEVEGDAEVVEPVEEVEPVEGAETVPDTGVVDEVDETEATSEEAGPDAEHDEPGVEVVESGPGDAQPDVAAERDQTRASGSDCAAGGSPWTLGWLVALALAVLVSGRRRRARTG